ncbi:MAG: hypothetical protein PUJ20_05175, partial [Bacteroidales bacterium]|nr:hypothetical protein [Bacteroidales bacterium]MDY4235047.1 hypothetical protein [Sodaliphilus sp.]
SPSIYPLNPNSIFTPHPCSNNFMQKKRQYRPPADFFSAFEVSRPYRVWFFAEGELFFYVFVSVPPVFIH